MTVRETIARLLCAYDYQWNTTMSEKDKAALIDKHWPAYAGRADWIINAFPILNAAMAA